MGAAWRGVFIASLDKPATNALLFFHLFSFVWLSIPAERRRGGSCTPLGACPRAAAGRATQEGPVRADSFAAPATDVDAIAALDARFRALVGRISRLFLNRLSS